jgi:hypothetical protein
MKTRITAVSTEFCRSNSSWRMSLDLSWLKLTTVPSGRYCLEVSGDGLHLIHGLDQVRADALGHFDGDGGLAVEAGHRLGFLHASGRMAAMSRTRTTACRSPPRAGSPRLPSVSRSATGP